VTLADLLQTVVGALNEAGIQHMLTGSVASSHHGAPRSTQDIDIVIDSSPAALERFIASFDPERYYLAADGARAALAHHDQFNLIDTLTGWKVDLVIVKNRPFSAIEFERREPATVFGVDTAIVSIEDAILSKLEWAVAGGSERQIGDAATMAQVAGSHLDVAYLHHWARELGVTDLLQRIVE
jgi:hypothetical protein